MFRRIECLFLLRVAWSVMSGRRRNIRFGGVFEDFRYFRKTDVEWFNDKKKGFCREREEVVDI